ncbi:hypothetical protein TIFTF001_041381 [Ficus carica]|uniref:Uncharacterized protein n=1 Tax=Ficus carica TaxID=3494 RepID=A0AA87Z5J3_FICCA|nr:hypothetical protein TIFTF001_041381 [Ficus carica]
MASKLPRVVPIRVRSGLVHDLDPIVIDISTDEEGDDEQAGWFEDQEDLADDPEEVIWDDGDWETDSNAAA